MGKKSWSSVVKEFFPAVDEGFRFLIDNHGFAGPRRVQGLNPSVSFVTAGFGYEVYLEARESKIFTTAWIAYDDRYISAGLDSLVEVAGLASNQSVLRSASSVASMRKSIVSQSGWVREIHLVLVGGSSGLEIMRLAKIHGGSVV